MLPDELTVTFTNVFSCVGGTTTVTRIGPNEWTGGEIECFHNIRIICEAGQWRCYADGIGVTIGTNLSTISCDPLDLDGFFSFLIGAEFPCCAGGSVLIEVTL